MAQLHFTLDHDFFVGLFSESKDEAFGKLMEAILNQVLLAESSEQLGAENYERSDERSDYRNGTRTRSLTTRVGKIELKVPRHRNVPFKTVLFENYQRNEQALITTMMEMVVQGVSTRNVQKVTEELCGESFSKSTVSEICKELDIPVKQFKERLLPEKYPFIIVDAIYLKARDDHRIKSKALFVAVGVNNTGHKEIIGFEVYDSEKLSTWKEFFESIKSRGLRGVDIVISDAHAGLVEAIKESFPNSSWQRCQAHFVRNIIDKCPKKYSTGLASELRDMFNASTIEEARRLEKSIYDEYQDVASEAMQILDEGFEDSVTIMALPSKYRIALRTSNIIERENREIRRREKVIQIFPNIESIIRLIGAVLQDDHNDWSIAQRLFDMSEYFDKFSSIQQKLHKHAA
jgi:transposase-like protein